MVAGRLLWSIKQQVTRSKLQTTSSKQATSDRPEQQVKKLKQETINKEEASHKQAEQVTRDKQEQQG